MDEVARLAAEHQPKLIIAGWSAYPRQLDFARFREIADEVGAYLLVDMAHFAGLVAAGLHPSPVPHAHVTTTTTHKTLGGPRGGVILSNDAEIAKKINSAVFPGQQGGPLEHVIAAKAAAFKMAAEPEFAERQRAHARGRADPGRAAEPAGRRRGRGQRAHRRHRRAPGAGRPARLASWTASRPRTGCTRSASRSTATRSRSTRARRWSPPGCASAPPALATRGFETEAFAEVADVIASTLLLEQNGDTGPDPAALAKLRARVDELARRHPLYPGLGTS